jgi:hypothetical protein
VGFGVALDDRRPAPVGPGTPPGPSAWPRAPHRTARLAHGAEVGTPPLATDHEGSGQGTPRGPPRDPQGHGRGRGPAAGQRRAWCRAERVVARPAEAPWVRAPVEAQAAVAGLAAGRAPQMGAEDGGGGMAVLLALVGHLPRGVGLDPHVCDTCVSPRLSVELPMLDSRVVIDQFRHNRLFLQAFHGGLGRCGILGESCLISSD